ncbi:hypothetical protein NGTWS0302_07650 [Mycolicibacterium cyprinidarum]|uniref:Helix-turn-helix domain-containing protein n=1 Tax=Mycolicibacterium cyprinidarum TaxID=2860311 RepID=A0ABQ4V8X2_9MYCO|nr:hypothetical protein NGTWS1702_35670 [Mycolicibacterium sp. NGTWSNA01]GJF14817.1 hypothetical protein NGTWS0302_07650 [Mycolicibacterium sp. NGTWS0302]GJF17799.1 hypothetical protein NGTWS1803_36020 [Mycolicibacterium sp. NGTWS1803]
MARQPIAAQEPLRCPYSICPGSIAPSFISVDHAAQVMDVSHWTIRRRITSGALPARKLPSGGLRIAVADLAAIREPVRPDRSGSLRHHSAAS